MLESTSRIGFGCALLGSESEGDGPFLDSLAGVSCIRLDGAVGLWDMHRSDWENARRASDLWRTENIDAMRHGVSTTNLGSQNLVLFTPSLMVPPAPGLLDRITSVNLELDPLSVASGLKIRLV